MSARNLIALQQLEPNGLSGFISTIANSILLGEISGGGGSGSIANAVYTTGNQTIGGVKTFSSVLTATGFQSPTGQSTIDLNQGILNFQGGPSIAWSSGQLFSPSSPTIPTLDYWGGQLISPSDDVAVLDWNDSILKSASQDSISLNWKFGRLYGEWQMDQDPESSSDIATKNYVDNAISSGGSGPISNVVYITGNQTVSGLKIFNSNITVPSVSGLNSYAINLNSGYLQNSGVTELDWNNKILSGQWICQDPTTSQGIATKHYIDVLSGSNFYVTPEQFGAKGDGVTDDAAALQSGVSYLQNTSGGILLLGKGRNYLVGSTVSGSGSYVQIEGAGGSSITCASGFASGDILSFDPGITPTQLSQGLLGLKFSNFEIKAQAPRTSGSAIKIKWSHHVVIENLVIGRSRSKTASIDAPTYLYDGISLINQSDCVIFDMEISTNRYGVYISGNAIGPGYPYFGADGILDGCNIQSLDSGTIATGGAAVVLDGGTGGFTISNSNVSGYYYGVLLNSGNREFFMINTFLDTVLNAGLKVVSGGANLISIINGWAAGCGAAGFDITMVSSGGRTGLADIVNITGVNTYSNTGLDINIVGANCVMSNCHCRGNVTFGLNCSSLSVCGGAINGTLTIDGSITDYRIVGVINQTDFPLPLDIGTVESDLAPTFALYDPLLAVINVQAGTTYTIQESDSGLIIESWSNDPVTITLPVLLENVKCTVVQIGLGAITFVGGTGVTIESETANLTINSQYSRVDLYISSFSGISGGTIATWVIEFVKPNTGTTVVAGVGAGSIGSPTASLDINADDRAGTITVVTTTSPSVSAIICSGTFGNPLAKIPHIIISPANALTSTLNFIPYTSGSVDGFVLQSSTTALIGSMTYAWNYIAL